MQQTLVERLKLTSSPFDPEKKKVFVGVTTDGGVPRLEYMDFEDFRLHTTILGATGAGKTQLLNSLIVQFIRNGWPILGIDMKFDSGLMESIAATAAICGREKDLKVLSPFGAESDRGILGEIGTCSYNPLISLNSPIAATSATLNAATRDQKNSNPFFSEIKEETVLTLHSAFISTGLPYSYKDMWLALDDARALQRLMMLNRDAEVHLLLQDWLEKMTSEDVRIKSEHAKYMQGAKMFFRSMGTGVLGSILSTYDPDVTLKAAYRDNQIVWCVLPSLQINHTAVSFGKLLLSELRYMAGEIQATTKERKPFMVVIDEFAKFLFPGIDDLFDKGRASGVCMVVAYQSMKQADMMMTKDFREVLMANTRNKIFMGTDTPDDAKYYAELIGKDDTATGLMVDGFSIREADQYFIQPRVFTEMDDFSFVLRRKGKTKRGHIVALPSNWRLGVDVPRPKFEPRMSREGGVRLWEHVSGESTEPASPAGGRNPKRDRGAAKGKKKAAE